MGKTGRFSVRQMSVKDLVPYAANPRQNDDAVTAVAESIRRFGFRVPIIVDSEGVIVAGHTRLKAAQLLQLDKVPVHVAADLTPEQARALRLADNKTAELAEWDMELLASELQGIMESGEDMGGLGFTEEELAAMDSVTLDGIEDPEEKEINDYTHINVFVTIDMEHYENIKEIIQKIKELEGVEVYQNTN